MKPATLKQGRHILESLETAPVEQVQAVIDSGFLADILAANVEQVDRNDLRRVLGLQPLFAEARLRTLKVVTTRKVKVSVDFDATIEQLVKTGHYDYANSNITGANFPTTGQGQLAQELELFQFSIGPESEEVEAYFRANGLEAVGMRHCLAVGRQHQDLQRSIWMVFLGDAWPGPNGFELGVLGGNSARRSLGLGRRAGAWNQNDWFAARRA